MLKSALGELFAELGKIKLDDRSPFEGAVYQELDELLKKKTEFPRFWAEASLGSNEIARLNCPYDKCPNKRR